MVRIDGYNVSFIPTRKCRLIRFLSDAKCHATSLKISPLSLQCKPAYGSTRRTRMPPARAHNTAADDFKRNATLYSRRTNERHLYLPKYASHITRCKESLHIDALCLYRLDEPLYQMRYIGDCDAFHLLTLQLVQFIHWIREPIIGASTYRRRRRHFQFDI